VWRTRLTRAWAQACCLAGVATVWTRFGERIIGPVPSPPLFMLAAETEAALTKTAPDAIVADRCRDLEGGVGLPRCAPLQVVGEISAQLQYTSAGRPGPTGRGS